MEETHDLPLLALSLTRENEAVVLGYAQALAAQSKIHLRTFQKETGTTRKSGEDGKILDEMKSFFRETCPGLIVADWSLLYYDAFFSIMDLVLAYNIPTVFTRGKIEKFLKRVLILTGGGPHTIQEMGVANKIASHLSLPKQIIRIIHKDTHDHASFAISDDEKNEIRLNEYQARIMGIRDPFELCLAENLICGIKTKVKVNDLVIIGAPNYWRSKEYFRNSTPDLIAGSIPNPLIMCLSKKAKIIALRNVFWDQLIKVRLAPKNKAEAFSKLIEALVKTNQFPDEWKGDLLSRALARESIMPTAVGRETAFPHITIPNFTGIIGALGICPEGVFFTKDQTCPTKFIFLFVTSDSYYDEYLSVIARISRLMIQPEIRHALLQCSTPADVLDILEATGR